MNYRIPKPDDRLYGGAAALPDQIRLLDFWRWAFSDLLEDYLKGLFAEWMVGVLAEADFAGHRRLEFGRYDHRIGPLRLEVKATARWQSWKVLDADGKLLPSPKSPATPDSKVRFANLRTRSGTYKADVYAFCFHKEEVLERWDALDLDQWEFYLVRRDQLDALGTMSITLMKVRELSPTMTARQFQDELRRELERHAA